MKKCIVVSDSFKGTLSSAEICAIAREIIPEYYPECQVITIPVADGGEGTVDCFISAAGAKAVFAPVQDPFGRTVEAKYALLGDTAVIEMAAAAGLPLVADEKDPCRASTFGVGQLIAHAIDRDCRSVLLGIGGSATNDGGCGCAAALGARFLDKDGQSFIPTGGTLSRIEGIELATLREKLQGIGITVMCDVENPLYGKNGAAHVFGPQKGADEEQVEFLDEGLRHLSLIIARELGHDVSAIPGSGAAGGMGAGCTAFLGAELKSGINAILDMTGFDSLLDGAELVISGEGRIDSQSLQGKVISGVCARTKPRGIPVLVIAGCIDDSAKGAYDIGVSAMFATNRASLPFEKLKDRAAEDYRSTLSDILRLMAQK